MNWSVGITTAPRKQGCYLEKTLNSIIKAGWSEFSIFAEPGSFIPNHFHKNVIQRPKNYGDWTNWATGFYELLLSNPESDYFMMVEDDAIVNKNCRKYIEQAIPQLKDFASISLYTPSIYNLKNFRGFHNGVLNERTWSTVTVIMSKTNAINFFSDSLVQNHRFADTFGLGQEFWCCPNTDFKNSIKDAVLGRWAFQNNLPIYYHTPSLAEHIGNDSTLTNEFATKENGRKSFDFVGEDDELNVFLKNPIRFRRLNKIPLF